LVYGGGGGGGFFGFSGGGIAEHEIGWVLLPRRAGTDSNQGDVHEAAARADGKIASRCSCCSDDQSLVSGAARSRCACFRRSSTFALRQRATTSARPDDQRGDKVVLWYVSSNRRRSLCTTIPTSRLRREASTRPWRRSGAHFCLGNALRGELKVRSRRRSGATRDWRRGQGPATSNRAFYPDEDAARGLVDKALACAVAEYAPRVSPAPGRARRAEGSSRIERELTRSAWPRRALSRPRRQGVRAAHCVFALATVLGDRLADSGRHRRRPPSASATAADRRINGAV